MKMRKDDNKMQAYVDEKTRLLLAAQAQESSISTSKYIAQVLTEHANNSRKDKVYRARVIAILTYILSCVYDKETVESNSNVTQELVDLIKSQCEEAYK